MKDLLVANRYAQALFDLAKPDHDEEVEAELVAFSECLKNAPELERALNNPHLKLEEKRKLFSRIYQGKNRDINNLMINFFTVLFEKNRFDLIHYISSAFKRIADESQGQGIAEIRSAVVLGPKAEAEIVSRLEKIAGFKITVKKLVDPLLIGGVMVKVRNKIIDGSVRNRIDVIKKELTKVSNI